MSTPSKSQFESARLKVQRAYRHIQELQAAFAAFLQSDFCRIAIEADSTHPGHNRIKIVSVADLPAKVSLIIGDTIHNLRSALDHVMREVLGKGGDRNTFPVGKERHNLESHSTYTLIKKSLPDLATIIRDEIMPYDNGKPCLWAASKLDNIDKHNLLIVFASVHSIRGMSFINKSLNIRLNDCSVAIDPLGVGRLATIPAPVEITNDGKLAAAILFGKGQPLGGEAVIESLTKIAELTLEAIQRLEAFWFRKGQKGQAE